MTADEWAKQTSRPIIGPGVNSWLLARRGDDDVSEADVRAAVPEVLAYWLGVPSAFVPGSSIRFLRLDVSRKPLELEDTAFRRETLPGALPTVASGGKPWYVRLSFVAVPSGVVAAANQTMVPSSLPWPVITRDLFGWTYAPSDHAEWLMLSAAAPRTPTEDELRQVELPLETFGRKAGEVAHDIAKGAGEGVKAGVSTAIAVAAVAVVAAVAAFALWTKATS